MLSDKTPSLAPWILALEFGGQSVKAARVNTLGKLVVPRSFPLDQKKPPTLESTLNHLSEMIQMVRQQTEIAAIGVGAPSPCDFDTLTFHLGQKPSYRHINGRRLRESIVAYAGCENLCAENDAIVAAKGEIWKGSHVEEKGRYIFLTLGTGLGACYVVDGRLVRGEEFGATASGELWDYPYKGAPLEETAGTTKAIVKAYVSSGGSDESVINGNIEHLAVMARMGDELAIETFRKFGALLYKGLAEPIRQFGPKAVVLSGNLANAFDLFERDANGSASDSTRFVKSDLIGQGGLLGAALCAINEFVSDDPV